VFVTSISDLYLLQVQVIHRSKTSLKKCELTANKPVLFQHFYNLPSLPSSSNMGKVLLVAVGVYAGILLKQRYKIPNVYSPADILERLKMYESSARQGECRHRRQSEDRSSDRREFWVDRMEMWERFKEFEKRQRKEQPQTQPQAQPPPPSQSDS